MVRKILSYFTLPLVLLLSNSSGNTASQQAPEKKPARQNATLEKMIVANGNVTMDLDLNRLNGIDSGGQVSKRETVRFQVGSNSFFTILVLNNVLRGVEPSTMALVPGNVANLPNQLQSSLNQLVLERLPSDASYEMAVRDGTTGFTFFNLEGHQYDYDATARSFALKDGRLLISEEFANKLGRPGETGAGVGSISFSTTVYPIEMNTLSDGAVQSSILPTRGRGGNEGQLVPGPDVIVGDLPSMAQFGSSVGTQVGLGIGTTSCNNGTIALNWFALGNTDHPVIPQNMYRMSGGTNNNDRFEQIGQSWLKHAFVALEGDACGFGCNTSGCATGSTLCTGCSDPYDAGLNASQGGLGSRAWVNPFTGVFPSTAASHSGHAHNGVAHRVLTEMADLNTTLNPGATYYAEGQYVTPHEHAWCQSHPGECNMYNNASYRRFNVSGTTSFTFSPVGSTVRMAPAINAWTGATINQIEPVPSVDGRAFVAYKVTGPVAGVWHYEYAIYNQNLDRSIQSFSVPVPAGATAINVGFHAPPNHPGFANDGTLGNGGYSNTPWASNQSGGNLSWSSETFAQNQNANAIRWGTLYNFRFDSNSPPQTTNATIGFFKTGAPITVAVQAPTGTGTPTPTATGTPPPSPSATPTSTASATASATPCGVTIFAENFDEWTPPLFPPGWVATNAQGAAPLWVTSPTNPDSPPNDAFVDDPADISDKLVDTQPISIPSSSGAQVTFRNNYDLESTFDGGVLEISINGGAFTDIVDAGGSFVTGAYNDTISTDFQSPIGGRGAWSGDSGGYITTKANLPAAALGQSIKLRFRMGSDNSVSATGWRVDSVVITINGSCGTPSASPSVTVIGTPSPSPTCVPVDPLAEGFNDITTLPGAGWVQTNHSGTVGTTNWFQGNDTVFPAQSGAATSYIGANFNNTAGTDTISNWLLTPPLQLQNGRIMTFYTRTVDAPSFPDRLQVRMSTNGSSSNVGTTATDVGDFTTLLLDINSSYTTTGYPNVWTQFTVTVSGVPTLTTGRLAFRYFVENGGPTGTNSDYIGIDSFQYSGGCGGGATPSPGTPPPSPTCAPDARLFTATLNGAQEVPPTGSTGIGGGSVFLNADQTMITVNVEFSGLTAAANAAHIHGPAAPGVSAGILVTLTSFPAATSGTYSNTFPVTPTQAAHLTNGLTYFNIHTGTFPSGEIRGQLLPEGVGTIFSQNFDGVTAPALPAGWTGPWVTSTTTPDTPPNHAFVDDPEVVSDKRLESPNIAISSAAAQLSFRNFYSLESTFDGGVLEVSSPNINGGAFTDVTDPAVGGSFASGGYNAKISTDFQSPIGGQMAWSGDSGGYINTVANLGPNVAGGPIKLRFRMASDNSVSATGWRVDTVRVIDGGSGCPSATPTATGTTQPTVTSTPTTTATASSSVTPSSTPSGTPTLTPIATPSASPAAQALNLSTRMRVLTEANVGIGGFIVTGTVPKTVLLRAIGPSLSNFGVPDPLVDPVMELHGPAGFTTITNDNWRDTQAAAIKATGLPPTNDLESAILATLDPGQYTAVVKGKENGVGVGLVEAYDLDPAAASKLGNISTRAFVGTGTDIMIAGFILGGSTNPDNVILRGIGPSLTQFGVPDALADPTLELRDNNGALIISNDNWQDDPGQAALITAAGLAPTDPAESAIVSTLSPGTYTALLAGKNSGTGVGLVEAYDLGAGAVVPTPTPGSPTPTATAGASPTATIGASPTATVGASPSASPTGPCEEDWDSVTAPALPPGWTATNPDPGDGTMWETSISTPESAPNDAFVPDQDGISDKVLDRMGVTINNASAVISWRNNFNTEFSDGIFWDGYVLEISSPNISGGAFLDFTDSHVGAICMSGCYTGEIDGTANNPLAGRMAWAGDSGGYIDTVINLGPNLAGQTITLRFRMGTDEAIAAPGVRMDNMSITDASCP